MNLDEESDDEVKSKVSEKGKWKKSSAAEWGLLPDIWNQIYRFQQIITWKTVNKKKVPEPK